MRKMSQSRQQDDAFENPTMKRLRGLTVPVMQESCPLSISTRAIGFMLPKVTEHLERMWHSDMDFSSDDEYYESERRKIEAPLSAMYRVCLAQLEAKVHLATSNQRLFLNPSLHDPTSLYDVQPSSLVHGIMNHVKNHNDYIIKHYATSPVSVIINSIGHVETNGMHYEPKFMKKVTPLNLRISNLRKYCEDMANPNTSAEDRKTGYLLNSIPNAKWEKGNDLETVVLRNPDDIISADYDMRLLQQDFGKMHHYLQNIRAEKNLNFRETIDYKGFGNPGILASTLVEPGFSCRLSKKNQVYSDLVFSQFWSREYLSRESLSIGVLTLAGEVLNPIEDPHRSIMLAAQAHDSNWLDVSNVFY